MRYLKVREFSKTFGVSRDWLYQEIRAGKVPLVSFCGQPITPWLIDVEKAQSLFSSGFASNVVPITSARRSLKTEKPNESIGQKSKLTKEDLWRD
jgi:hypothetical protein